MPKKFDVNNENEFKKVMGDRLKNARKRQVNNDKVDQEKDPQAQHMEMANLLLKVINSLNIDPIIKRVTTMRIMGPLKTGQERTRISIALELGMSVNEVEQIEEAGQEILDHHLQRTDLGGMIETFNRDRAIDNALRNELNDK